MDCAPKVTNMRGGNFGQWTLTQSQNRRITKQEGFNEQLFDKLSVICLEGHLRCHQSGDMRPGAGVYQQGSGSDAELRPFFLLNEKSQELKITIRQGGVNRVGGGFSNHGPHPF